MLDDIFVKQLIFDKYSRYVDMVRVYLCIYDIVSRIFIIYYRYIYVNMIQM